MRETWSAAVENAARYIRSPKAFAREVLRVDRFEPYQEKLLDAAPSAQQIALVGSKGVGKTTAEAWLIWWYLFTRPDSNIAVTSISGDNLRDGLRKELAKWQQRAPLLRAMFNLQQMRITSRERPDTWWVSFRTWSKTADAQAQADTLAGLHADSMLFVIDEAGSVPQAVAVTAQAALSSGSDCKLILAGNPTSPDGPLYRAAVTHRKHFHVVRVNGDPEDPNRSSLVDRQWAQQQIDSYGRDNPWVKVNVLGEFPPAALNALLGVEEVERAMGRGVPEAAYTWAQKRLGVDVARYGDDRTVIFPRQGKVSFRPRVLRHDRGSAVSVDIATAVIAAKTKWGSEVEIFDATGGWAAGAVDVMRASGYETLDVQFAAPAMDQRYANRRAELWFTMAEWIKAGASLPNMPELLAELTAVTYSFVRGKFQLEPKESVKARIGRSPDLADGLSLTFGLPEMPAALVERRRQSVGKVLTDFDPWKGAYG
jgi:phage terminase large subunit